MEHVFGDSTGGSAVMTKSWTLNRASMGLIGYSSACEALAEAIRSVLEREHFRKRIRAHQLVQQLLANAAIEIEAGRLLCYRALSYGGGL